MGGYELQLLLANDPAARSSLGTVLARLACEAPPRRPSWLTELTGTPALLAGGHGLGPPRRAGGSEDEELGGREELQAWGVGEVPVREVLADVVAEGWARWRRVASVAVVPRAALQPPASDAKAAEAGAARGWSSLKKDLRTPGDGRRSFFLSFKAAEAGAARGRQAPGCALGCVAAALAQMRDEGAAVVDLAGLLPGGGGGEEGRAGGALEGGSGMGEEGGGWRGWEAGVRRRLAGVAAEPASASVVLRSAVAELGERCPGVRVLLLPALLPRSGRCGWHVWGGLAVSAKTKPGLELRPG
jgi:hypothetical protein